MLYQLTLRAKCSPLSFRVFFPTSTFGSSSFFPHHTYLYLLTAAKGTRLASIPQILASYVVLRETDCHPLVNVMKKGNTHDAYVAHQKSATFTVPPKAPEAPPDSKKEKKRKKKVYRHIVHPKERTLIRKFT